MSKLDYLKKYMSSENSKPKKKKIKNSGFTIIDEAESIGCNKSSLDKSLTKWEEDSEEDTPIVVNTNDNNYVARGSWEVVPITNLRTKDPSPPRRRRHDDDESPPRRNAPAPPNSNAMKSESGDISPPRRRRHDDDDESPPQKSDASKRQLTSSGHIAGLHSGKEFGKEERILKKRRDEEVKELAALQGSASQETVYRDKRGRKLDMLNEFMRQEALREGKEVKIAKAQYEWGKGTVQKEIAQQARDELNELANEPFARTIDDPKIERIKKDTMRDGDPMAQYMLSIQKKELVEKSIRTGKPLKPIYKGPAPVPNRFGILPGYRWDGIDRGNKFEHILLTSSNSKNSLREDEYKWSVSDM